MAGEKTKKSYVYVVVEEKNNTEFDESLNLATTCTVSQYKAFTTVKQANAYTKDKIEELIETISEDYCIPLSSVSVKKNEVSKGWNVWSVQGNEEIQYLISIVKTEVKNI